MFELARNAMTAGAVVTTINCLSILETELVLLHRPTSWLMVSLCGIGCFTLCLKMKYGMRDEMEAFSCARLGGVPGE